MQSYIIVPQRQEPSSCCTSSSLVWQRWQRLRLRCLEPLRDEDGDDDDDDADKDDDDDEDSSLSGTTPTLARFSGETSLSDSEAGDKYRRVHTKTKREKLSTVAGLSNCNCVKAFTSEFYI